MARTTFKYWKFLVHVFCIIITAHNINERLNYTKIVRFERFLTDIKHILIWTDLYGVTEEGQTHFIKKKCSQINCYFTKDRTLFGDLRYFDAIVFNASDLENGGEVDIPDVKGMNQVYIFAADKTPHVEIVCNPVYDGFFNWTWTYRHDSTLSYRFITIYNNRSEELGSHFHWPPHMDPTDPNFISLLATKSKAAAIFLDECKTKSHIEDLITRLQNEMNRYNLTLDVYGKCGTKECKRRTLGACNWRLKKQYFFYLAFEESIDYDYVTGSVLTAYNNNVVPVVYGGANYENFLPPNSYINAKKLSAQQVARKIFESIKDKQKYYDFFGWRNHYQIKPAKPLDACSLCSKLAERPQLMGRNVYEKFREWWSPKYEHRCFMASVPKDESLESE